ncbi:MAG TPA: toll/interleukin-1 receptor domain-containing protein [Candidatus Angelobacter sp.]|jgi:tetratricopeptide (TPR) repeat protein|nr:toll/interleukin-1 receptor domain-containing protein [Candidatus Angelobacter sp.]
MPRIDKTAFLSYRRTNGPWALAISKDLTHDGYDVFFDYTGLASGDFEGVILDNIHSRAHFLVLLTPSALERCSQPGDWLRREIEAALDARRNIVPLMLEGFDFDTPSIAQQLTGKLALLRKFNALTVSVEYFDAAMEKLRRFLNVALETVVQPTSLAAASAATESRAAVAEAPAVAESELTAQQWFERGINAYNHNSFEEAVQLFSNAIRLNPDNPYAFNNRGLARYDLRDFAGALQDYAEAFRLDPQLPEVINNRGNVYLEQGNLEGALKDYDESLRLRPTYAVARRNIGLVCDKQGDSAGALAAFNEAVKLDPKYADAYNSRGSVRGNTGDFDGALEDFNQALQLNPSDPVAARNRDSVLKLISNRKPS